MPKISSPPSDGVAPVNTRRRPPGRSRSRAAGRPYRITADANGLATGVIVEFGTTPDVVVRLRLRTGVAAAATRAAPAKPGRKYFFRSSKRGLRRPAALVHRGRQRLEAANRRGDRQRRQLGVLSVQALLHDPRQRQRADAREAHPSIAWTGRRSRCATREYLRGRPRDAHWYNWRANVSPGRYRFCVVGYDTKRVRARRAARRLRIR